MNANTRVHITWEGNAVVHTGNEEQFWVKELIEKSMEHSLSCCNSRNVCFPGGAEHCACLACNVAKAYIKWKEDRERETES